LQLVSEKVLKVFEAHQKRFLETCLNNHQKGSLRLSDGTSGRVASTCVAAEDSEAPQIRHHQALWIHIRGFFTLSKPQDVTGHLVKEFYN
jgi:hypothetical protein